MELSREDKMIKQLCKTFKEDTDSYWLNTQRYVEEAAKYNFDPRRMQIKMEMLDRGENEKIPSRKTIGRVMDYCRGLVREEYKDPSITISTIKLLGEALCGDAYAFLIKIERENILKVGMEVQEIYGAGDLNRVYAMMNELIYWIAESQYYNRGRKKTEKSFLRKRSGQSGKRLTIVSGTTESTVKNCISWRMMWNILSACVRSQAWQSAGIR